MVVKPSILIENLSCERSDRLLFSKLSMEIEAGQVLQIRGPNGAGKTTLLRILTGLSSDYLGRIQWCGRDLRESLQAFRSQLLYIGHLPGIKKALTAEENLNWYARFHAGVPQLSIPEALAEVGLAGYEDVPCQSMSAGQQRRVNLARLFLTPAPLWVLDEPFTAIDVGGVAMLQARITEHTSGGGIVILTSHQELDIKDVKYLNLQDFWSVSDE
ncbi:cytochrome c biogenesis heme-transporting ATPase CcmA [Aurantivibrio plasticivorans]